jgi:hypothetical protein
MMVGVRCGLGVRGCCVALAAALGLALSAAIAVASHRTISRSEALAVARAISLRPSDLPTLVAESNPITAQFLRDQAAAAACEGTSPPSEDFALAQSNRFAYSTSHAALSIQSVTKIAPSVSVVASDLAAAERPHALACVTSLALARLRATLPMNETATASYQLVKLHESVTDGSFGARVIITLHVRRGGTTTNVPIYTVVVAFAYGQAEVSLVTETVRAPPPLSLEERLAAILVTRARAAIG